MAVRGHQLCVEGARVEGARGGEGPRVVGARARVNAAARVGPPVLLLLLLAALLCVRGSPMPAHVVTDKLVTVMRGAEVTLLRCVLSGAAAMLVQVRWLKVADRQEATIVAVMIPGHRAAYPSSPYVGRARFRTKNPWTDASLEILNVTSRDAGFYWCHVDTIPAGNLAGRVELSVIVTPTLSLEAIPGVTVTDNGTEVAVAMCQAVEGMPPAVLLWKGTAALLALRGKHAEWREVQLDGTVTVKSEFRMVPTRVTNGQLLYCTGIHPGLAAMGKTLGMKLSVKYAPEVTSIEGFDSGWYLGRVGAELRCHSEGNPPPTIVWMKKNARMPEDAQRLGNTLRFSAPLSRVHDGFYACYAFNELGSRLRVVEVEIRVPPSPPIISGDTGPIREGRNASLLCSTNHSKPAAQVAWYRSGQPLKGLLLVTPYPGEVVTFAVSSTVTFEHQRGDDGVVLECRVTQPGLGSKSMTATHKLSVHFPPQVVQWKQEVVAIAGDNISLSCETEGNPRPHITWSRLRGNLWMETVAGDDGRLVLLSVHRRDDGEYSCLATNLAGKDSAIVILRVLEDTLDPTGGRCEGRRGGGEGGEEGGRRRDTGLYAAISAMVVAFILLSLVFMLGRHYTWRCHSLSVLITESLTQCSHH